MSPYPQGGYTVLCRKYECRSLSASCLPRHLHLPVRRERRDAQERPLFALRVDNFSRREWALPGSARRARTRGEADQEEGPVDLPPAERVRHGRRTPAFEHAGTAKRRKVRVKKATDGLFQQPA